MPSCLSSVQVPGQYLLTLQVEFPELWPSRLSPHDSITTEPTFVLTVTWPVRLLKSPSHREYCPTSIPPLSTHNYLFRNHMPIGSFERYQGRGGVNSSTSRDRWSEMSTRIALLSQDENYYSETDTAATKLAYMIDSMSPRSIVHLADGAVPKVRSCLFHFQTSEKIFLRMSASYSAVGSCSTSECM
jgi:hypothetical protein